MLTSAQIRAARSLLGWPARRLAEQAGVHISTVQRMERARGQLRGNVRSVAKIQQTLETAGIEFLSSDDNGLGVRLKGPAAKM